MGNCFTSEDPSRKPAVAGQPPSSSPVRPSGPSLSPLRPSTPRSIEDFRLSTGNANVHIFTYHEMRLATRNFRPDLVLGEGGFGTVYKGLIDENVRPGFKSSHVAVKVLNPEGCQGDREWLTEVNYLGQLSHPSLVNLVGYCCEDDHRLLVYEYMASGSLEKHLFRKFCHTMPWPTRMKIALNAAEGLAFLHGAERPIIFRDFKTSNILLDAAYNAKLSDFGLAKDGPMGDQTHVSTRVIGTYGYAAPEYVLTGRLTAKSDVYGFGVVLVEMLTGRKALDRSLPCQEQNLVEWGRPLLNHSRTLLSILDPRMEGQYSLRTAQKVATVAYHCTSPSPKARPTMSEVVETLEYVQGRSERQDDARLQRGGTSGDDPESKNLGPSKTGDERDQRERRDPRRPKGGNGRRQNEPAGPVYSTSPEVNLQQRRRREDKPTKSTDMAGSQP